MTDIVERLTPFEYHGVKLAGEARVEIVQLRAEIERLRGVIRKAHDALTKSSLVWRERIQDATIVLASVDEQEVTK